MSINTIQQHYVPEVYLKRFANKDEKLYVFDKLQQIVFPKPNHTGNIATQRYFYDFPEDFKREQRVQEMENLFSEIETRDAKFNRHIIKKIDKLAEFIGLERVPTSAKVFTDEQKKDLSVLIAIQALRTKEMRNFISDVFQKTKDFQADAIDFELQRLVNLYEKENPVKIDEQKVNKLTTIETRLIQENLENMYENAIALVHGEFIFKHYQELAETYRSHIWLIGINNTQNPLIISDHPVAKKPHLEGYGNTSEGMEIVFPVNRKIILIMQEKQYFKQNANLNNTIIFLTPEQIDDYNKQQFFSSTRFIYCVENNFHIVQELCKQHPNLCSSDKDRVQVDEFGINLSR